MKKLFWFHYRSSKYCYGVHVFTWDRKSFIYQCQFIEVFVLCYMFVNQRVKRAIDKYRATNAIKNLIV